MELVLVRTVLLDLDGVVRHFDPALVCEVEVRHGLEPGVLDAAAFEPTLLNRAITGEITRAEWVARVGAVVDNPAAAAERLSERGRVDWKLIEEVTALREAGVVVAILTNGTDTIDEEMLALGIVDHFDAIFNSASIGYAKPDRRVFEHVCRILNVAASDVFFTDDTASNVAAAKELGMIARLFEGVAGFRRHVDEFVHRVD
ncbi:MAG: HAD-IA family hydrolase [Acidimicrobiales bacterium]